METEVQQEVVLAVLKHLRRGEISEATAHFADGFHFYDRGIDLEFTDSGRLAAFFTIALELYPESSLRIDKVLVSGDYVTIQWTSHTVLLEPFFGGLKRKVPITLQGASIVGLDDGRIMEWSDYYDGLKSRRTALAAHFENWVEL